MAKSGESETASGRRPATPAAAPGQPRTASRPFSSVIMKSGGAGTPNGLAGTGRARKHRHLSSSIPVSHRSPGWGRRVCAKCPGRCSWAGGWGLAGADVGDRAAGGVRGVDALCGLPVPEAGVHLASHAVCKPGAGALTRWVAHCCHEHAGQSFTPDRAPGQLAVLQAPA